jgi:hypothetical protein
MWLCRVIKVFLTNTSKAKRLLYQRHKKSGVKMVVIALLVSGKRELFFIYLPTGRKKNASGKENCRYDVWCRQNNPNLAPLIGPFNTLQEALL